MVIAVIVAAYLAIASQYAARTPDWQAPDEPAHYNYVRQIADDQRLPVLRMGDWQQAYQDELKARGFDPALLDRLDTVQYEDHQPPLYYLLQAPVYVLTDGDLLALRLISVLLGVGVVICTWAVLWVCLPRYPYLALSGAGFVAFLPQHLSILGSVSNDALAELITGLTLLAMALYLGNSRRLAGDNSAPPRSMPPLTLGVLVGLALTTKTTIYFLGGIAVLAVLLRWRRERWPWQRAARHLVAVLIPALLIGGIWWVRNMSVYGGLDFAGLQRHDEITIGQTRRDAYIEQVCGGSTRVYLENMVRTTFHSFWGQFGWMAVPMPPHVYRVLLGGMIVTLAGIVPFGWRNRWPRSLSDPQRAMLVIFGAVIGCVVAAFGFYNLDFVQFQGRYLYPALIPLAFLVAIGIGGWMSLAESRFPALDWLPVTVMIGLALFAWYALDTYLVPNLPAW
jgi:4-amino-4-deoxy-L-arabinose transferase-like glycosyltransferase